MLSKLTSRKFWLAAVGVIVGVLGMLGADDNTIQLVSSVGLILIPAIIYIITEGKVDAAAVAAQVNFEELVEAIADYFTDDDEGEETGEEAQGEAGAV